jgi:alpha-tubulin suppressor-like RCC1 family protein
MCALKNNGDVYCWGYNHGVENPDPDTNEWITIKEPQLIESEYSLTSLYVNGGLACGITTEQRLACWGTLFWPPVMEPVIVEGLSSVSIVGLGQSHICAVGKADENDPEEKLYCWGHNSYGQLGVDTDGNSLDSPTEVDTIQGQVVDVSGGLSHTCAIVKENESNQVYCWGLNSTGQLGNGSTRDTATPTLVPGAQGAVQVFAGNSHTTILKENGSVQSWGLNKEGQLGNGALFRRQLPVHIHHQYPNLNESLIDIISGDEHTCALTESGSVYCWGGNNYGQVGNGSTEFVPEPVKIINTGVASISVGPYNTCAILEDTGEIMCWGYSISNDGNVEACLSPSFVVDENEDNITDMAFIGQGNGHYCALNEVGKLFCWGFNSFGELATPVGDDFPFYYPYPKQVDYFDEQTVIALSVGMQHVCAIVDPGEVYCWGVNYNGELGIGTQDFEPHPEPERVADLSDNFVDLSASMGRTCALSDLGDVYCWGCGSFEQLKPQLITDLPGGVSELSTGGSLFHFVYHTCAILKNTGGVKCWGYNNYSQFGDGTYRIFADWIPVDTLGLSGNVKSIRAGALSTCALFDSGSAACWGSDYQMETTPVNLVEVNEMGLPPSKFFSNYYEGSPESYFVITGLYFPPNQSLDIYINDTLMGNVITNETGVFKFFTYFEKIGEYTVRVEISNSSGRAVNANRETSQTQLDISINEMSVKRVKEGDGYTIGDPGSGIQIFLPVILR